MKKLFSVLLLMTVCLSFAQINYKPGYYIANNGIKTECLIKDLAWKNNPVEFEYKVAENDEAAVKTIADVAEFSVANSYKFIRFITDLDRSWTGMYNIGTEREPQWTKETLFLKVLVEGSINLYAYEDGNLIRYFYSRAPHTEATQLVYKEYTIGSKLLNNSAYKQQLYNEMKDKITSEQSFEKLKYLKAPLVKLFNTYNNNLGEKAKDYTERQNKGSVNLKVTPGFGTASFLVDNTQNNNDFDFGNELTYRLGVEVEYILPFNNNKWSIFTDPNFQQFTASGKDGEREWNAKLSYLQLPFGARHYFFLNEDTKVFINALYTLSLDVGSSIRYDKYELDTANTSLISIGGGVSHGRFSGEVRYGFKHGVLNYKYIVGEYSHINFILGFKLL